jgi:5-methylcytosine-specific restriction enzyme A
MDNGRFSRIEPGHQEPITSYSWRIVAQDRAIKVVDRSVLLHHGSGIPTEVRPFFRAEGMLAGGRKPLRLTHAGRSYEAYIEAADRQGLRTRLFWRSDFATVVQSAFPIAYAMLKAEESPAGAIGEILFERTTEDVYDVELSPEGTVRLKPGHETHTAQVPFKPGRPYHRQQDIHGPFGGSPRGGIAPCRNFPLVFLFTGGSGEQYGYEDDWASDDVFVYTGEGQVGDMEFVRGNRAIRDHLQDGRDLLLFQASPQSGFYTFLGQFVLASWEFARGPDREDNERRVIRFHLVPADALTDSESETGAPQLSLDLLRAQAMDAPSEAKARDASRTVRARSKAVRRYVLARAAGRCERCGRAAPFHRPDGTPYLEPHHIERLSDDGPDNPVNVAALCPNCHSEAHCGECAAEMQVKLRAHIDHVETPEED